MVLRFRTLRRLGVVLGVLGALLVIDALGVWAASLTMKDGRILRGRIGMVGGVAEDRDAPAKKTGEVVVQSILILDDGLSRTFVSKRQVSEVNEAVDPRTEKIRIDQRVCHNGLAIGGIGPIINIEPWDRHGRRIFSMMTTKGQVDVVQGITMITPVYTKVEALQGGKRPYVWEMRLATSSIPRETLSKILANTIDPTDSEHRLKIVRLYLQSERYRDAQLELAKILEDFPELKELEAQLRSLRQLAARRLLREMQLRMSAGQHDLMRSLLANFPDDNVAGETLEHVREILREYRDQDERIKDVLQRFDELMTSIDNPGLRGQMAGIHDEIVNQLSPNTLDRMAAFVRLADDETLTNQQRLALAMSGWLMGTHHATENFLVALSLYEVRDLIQQYLSEPTAARRGEILDELLTKEGATPEQVARLIGNMKPPLESHHHAGDPDGYYELVCPGLVGEADVTYYVQLPPEYDPHRRYPMIVTLNGAGSTPQLQLDWWAGAPDKQGKRAGQATRNGYITITVEWQRPHQDNYKYSSREHHAVLSCLRDAWRRFSVDTDRVFLSGHDIGGDAAWDLGLAHPDLWAGVIPIVAVADRFCSHYWENARHVPYYVVCGELDGNKIKKNSRSLDRYLRRHYDTIVVEYLGRGHEHFYDEIQRLFDWMGRRERNFFPQEFTCATMREWDNYFWWLEISGLPPRSLVDPADWPPPRGSRPLKLTGSIKRKNRLSVKSGSDHVTVWLTPEVVDFQEQIVISINGRRVRSDQSIKPDLTVLLEDVRTRGDRNHPFWAKVESR